MPTTTERAASTATHNGHNTSEPTLLAEQVVLTTAGAATRTVETTRKMAEGALNAVDTLVQGSFDLAEQLTRSTLLTDVAVKGLSIGRQSWGIGIETSRQVLASL